MIKGLGYAVPEKTVTNNDLTQIYETSDEWIYTRTGIKERHVFTSDEEAFELLKKAANQAVFRSCRCGLTMKKTCRPINSRSSL